MDVTGAQHLAGVWLYVQRVQRILYFPLLALLTWLLLAAMGAWQMLSGWVQLGFLVSCFVGLIIWSRQCLQRLQAPTKQEVQRYLEQRNALKHQPLQAIQDTPLQDTPLWIRHQQQMQSWLQRRWRVLPGISRLKISRLGKPAFRMLSLQTAMFSLLLVFLLDGKQSWEQLRHSLSPKVSVTGLNRGVDFTAILQPPTYTGMAAQSLTAVDMITAWQGSHLQLQVTESWLTPKLMITPCLDETACQQDQSVNLPTDQAVVKSLTTTGIYSLHLGILTLASWRIKILEDMPPEIRWEKKPQLTSNNAVAVRYQARDDLGLKAVKLLISPVDQPLRVQERILMEATGLQKGAADIQYLDLTDSSLSGQIVDLRMIATDRKGQHTGSPSVSMRLPMRVFQHPLAQEIAVLCHELLSNTRSPLDVGLAVHYLLRDTTRFGKQLVAYLLLNSVGFRLTTDIEKQGELQDIAELMWQAAILLDGTQQATPTQDMRMAFAKLQQILQNKNATPEEIAAAFKALQEALDAFARQIQRGQQQQPSTAGNASKSLGLADLLQQLARLAQSGQGDLARQALAKLQEMLENADYSGKQAQALQQVMQALQQLQGLIPQQQQLLEDTQVSSKKDSKALAMRQDKLHQALMDIMAQIKKAGVQSPETLQDAAKHMQQAKQALHAGNPGAAMPEQQQALTALQQGTQDMQQQVQQQLSLSLGGSRARLGAGGTADPWMERLGVPTTFDANTLQRIVEEIREKLNDPQLQDVERNYLQRLLPSF